MRNYIKLSLLKSYLSTDKFDVICLPEPYLDSDISHEGVNLEIISYTLIRADHSSNTKRGGTCIIYRYSLAFPLLNIQFLEECINLEILFGDKICSFVSCFCSPSHSHDLSETLADHLELTLDTIANKNLYLVVILGDFSATS